MVKLSIAKLQPSQLYISRRKLARVKEAIDRGVELPPVPIKRLDGRLVLTDGHTRTYALWNEGATKVRCEWDDDPLDWTMYRLCVYWALSEEIDHVKEMVLIDGSNYQEMWIDMCSWGKKQLDQTLPDRGTDNVVDFSEYPELNAERYRQ